MISILISTLYLFATIAFAEGDDQFMFLKPEAGRLNYIVNNSKTFSVLAVGYKICSYDHANVKVNAWECKGPNNIAIVAQDKAFVVSVPKDLNKLEYATQIFSVKDALNDKSEELFPHVDICRADGDNDTLMLTDVGSNDNRMGKIKCNMLRAF